MLEPTHTHCERRGLSDRGDGGHDGDGGGDGGGDGDGDGDGDGSANGAEMGTGMWMWMGPDGDGDGGGDGSGDGGGDGWIWGWGWGGGKGRFKCDCESTFYNRGCSDSECGCAANHDSISNIICQNAFSLNAVQQHIVSKVDETIARSRKRNFLKTLVHLLLVFRDEQFALGLSGKVVFHSKLLHVLELEWPEIVMVMAMVMAIVGGYDDDGDGDTWRL